MCNASPQVMDQLTATVKQFLDEGRMFTGYDITIETRLREKIRLRHEDVRGAIHEIQELNDAIEFGHEAPSGTVTWNKSQISMPNGGWAFVYHPSNLDPNNYQPRGSAPQVAPVQTSSVVSNDGAVSDSGGQQSDGTYATDYRNRLLVPTKYLKEAGFQAGDNVCVVPSKIDSLILLMRDSLGGLVAGTTTQIVERNGDLRLSSRTLHSADLKGSKFKIETEDHDFGGTTAKVVLVRPS